MLEIVKLSCFYNADIKAVDDLSIKVEDGDLFGLVGHNGAGKTTTLKSVVGVLPIEKGDILIDHISIKTDPIAYKQKISFVQEQPVLYNYLSGNQYLNFICDVYQIQEAHRKKLIYDLAEQFEMESRLDHLISTYSHGMRQKVAIVGALLHNPRLLVLDEPFIGLDAKAFLVLKQHMVRLCEQGGAVIFSSHILDVVENLCNKIGLMKKGKLVSRGYTKDVLGGGNLEKIFMESLEDVNHT